jgi:hypothetical protein
MNNSAVFAECVPDDPLSRAQRDFYEADDAMNRANLVFYKARMAVSIMRNYPKGEEHTMGCDVSDRGDECIMIRVLVSELKRLAYEQYNAADELCASCHSDYIKARAALGELVKKDDESGKAIDAAYKAMYSADEECLKWRYERCKTRRALGEVLKSL